ncbi:MAG: hypothetical protein EZS28_028371, partial [Streblomastix strix]
LVVSLKSESGQNDDTVKQYKLEDFATVWENDTQVTAFIKADEFVKRGLTLVVSVLVQTADNSLQEAQLVAGGSNTVVVEEFEGEMIQEEAESGMGIGKILRTLMIVGLVILIVALVVMVVIALITVGCIIYRNNHSSSRESESSLGEAGLENRE